MKTKLVIVVKGLPEYPIIQSEPFVIQARDKTKRQEKDISVDDNAYYPIGQKPLPLNLSIGSKNPPMLVTDLIGIMLYTAYILLRKMDMIIWGNSIWIHLGIINIVTKRMFECNYIGFYTTR